MCDIGKALSRAFSPPGTGALLNNLQGQQGAADQSADTASKALTDAISQMSAASVPARDNPSAIAAQQDEMRKLMGARGAAWSFGNAPTAAPVTGTKVLLGA